MTIPVDGCTFGLHRFPPLKVANTEKAPGNELKSVVLTLSEMCIAQVFIHKGANFLSLDCFYFTNFLFYSACLYIPEEYSRKNFIYLLVLQ